MVEAAGVAVVNAYVPNSGEGLRRLAYRTGVWDPAVKEYLQVTPVGHAVAWDLDAMGYHVNLPWPGKQGGVFTGTAALSHRRVPQVQGGGSWRAAFFYSQKFSGDQPLGSSFAAPRTIMRPYLASTLPWRNYPCCMVWVDVTSSPGLQRFRKKDRKRRDFSLYRRERSHRSLVYRISSAATRPAPTPPNPTQARRSAWL